MKKIHFTRTALLASIALLAIWTMSSFALTRGGEGFQVFIDNKPVLEHFGKDLNKAGQLSIDPQMGGKELRILYHHCGKNGQDRKLTLRDAQQRVVKSWTFANKGQSVTAMQIPIAEIPFSGKSGAVNRFTLHYQSKEIPNGRQLLVLNQGQSKLAVK